jgi:hypothetical protein
VGVGLVLMIWPDLPERWIDRFKGERGWRARRPIYMDKAPHTLVLSLDPPDGAAMVGVRCEITRGDEVVDEPARPPGSSLHNGVPNADYHFVFHDNWLALQQKAPPIRAGRYRVVWYAVGDRTGRRVLRVRRFRVRDDGRVTPSIQAHI